MTIAEWRTSASCLPPLTTIDRKFHGGAIVRPIRPWRPCGLQMPHILTDHGTEHCGRLEQHLPFEF